MVVRLLLLQLTLYDDNRYELEGKFTQCVALSSRPVWPQLDLHPLAALLNKFELCYSSQSNMSGMDSSSQQHDQDAGISDFLTVAAAAAAGGSIIRRRAPGVGGD